jgi:hypothetical protein
MIDPILQIINKVSKLLWGENIDLSLEMYKINSLQLALIKNRNENTIKTIFDTCTYICEIFDISLTLPTWLNI